MTKLGDKGTLWIWILKINVKHLLKSVCSYHVTYAFKWLWVRVPLQSPVEVIKKGAFERTYFRDTYSGINGKWYKKSWIVLGLWIS